ncbi:nuclear transcription factor Y subunit B-6-like isoform X1 [Actinidia eriantha]|uniref:nuclear transcription factor Y subunit B-6-like isoform X1 n=1 Tax=Actinidia eriantha TaxID=165200 RepID=UPI00258BC978|nr:nuclear transcription factor Y subunit B-6-like isoform X1 [Actinidia eriantha]
MERGESGGFHGYRRPPQTSSASGMKLQPDTNMRLPDQINNPSSNNSTHSTTEHDNECTVREQDRFMPIANVIRIMRKILPPHAKISDDSKETIQECVSEFISFITGEANDRCQREQRKTITAEDVLWAMSKLGFDDYIEPLTLYLSRYREFEGDRGSIRGEPFVKRAVDFAPVFQLRGHHNGFFGSAMGGFFLKDLSNEGSSQAPVAGIEPYAQIDK